MLDGDKKIFMTVTLNFYIVVNENYLYNYSEKNLSMIVMSQKLKNNQIKFIKIIFYMMKINKNKNIKKINKCVSYK